MTCYFLRLILLRIFVSCNHVDFHRPSISDSNLLLDPCKFMANTSSSSSHSPPLDSTFTLKPTNPQLTHTKPANQVSRQLVEGNSSLELKYSVRTERENKYQDDRPLENFRLQGTIRS